MSLPLFEITCAIEPVTEDTNDESLPEATNGKTKNENRIAAIRARMRKRSRKRDQNEALAGDLSPFNQFILLLETSLDIKSQRALDPSCFIDYITLLTINFCGNAQKILLHSQTRPHNKTSLNNGKIDKVINIASIAPIFRLEPWVNGNLGSGDSNDSDDRDNSDDNDSKEDENRNNVRRVGCYEMGVDVGVFIDVRGNYNYNGEGYAYYLNRNFEWNIWYSIGKFSRWPLEKKVACIIVNKNKDNICICSNGSKSTFEMINGKNGIKLLDTGICYFWTQIDANGIHAVYGIDQNLSV